MMAENWPDWQGHGHRLTHVLSICLFHAVSVAHIRSWTSRWELWPYLEASVHLFVLAKNNKRFPWRKRTSLQDHKPAPQHGQWVQLKPDVPICAGPHAVIPSSVAEVDLRKEEENSNWGKNGFFYFHWTLWIFQKTTWPTDNPSSQGLSHNVVLRVKGGKSPLISRKKGAAGLYYRDHPVVNDVAYLHPVPGRGNPSMWIF